MKRFLALLVWLSLMVPSLAAPGLDLQVSLEQESDPLPFGKPAELILKVSWDKSWEFEAPAAESLELPGFTIIDSFTTEPLSEPGRQALEYHLVFTRFEKGTADIGPVVFDTPAGPVKSEVLKLEYKGAEPKEGDEPGKLRGVKPVKELSTADFWRRLLAWILGIASVLALLAALANHFRLFDRWLSPKRRALKRLRRLAKALAQDQLDPEKAATDLVEILRDYLFRAYQLMTWESTSNEIQEQVTMNNRSHHLKDLVKNVTTHGDQIKFANKTGSKEKTQDLLGQMTTVISQEKGKTS